MGGTPVALAFEEPVKLPRDSSSWDIDGWREESSCRDLDANLFFPAGETGPAARRFCEAVEREAVAALGLGAQAEEHFVTEQEPTADVDDVARQSRRGWQAG